MTLEINYKQFYEDVIAIIAKPFRKIKPLNIIAAMDQEYATATEGLERYNQIIDIANKVLNP